MVDIQESGEPSQIDFHIDSSNSTPADAGKSGNYQYLCRITTGLTERLRRSVRPQAGCIIRDAFATSTEFFANCG